MLMLIQAPQVLPQLVMVSPQNVATCAQDDREGKGLIGGGELEDFANANGCEVLHSINIETQIGQQALVVLHRRV